MGTLQEIVTRGAAAMGLPLPTGAAEKLYTYYQRLEAVNAVTNLTAITGETDCANLHFLDSMALLALFDFRGKSVIDVGSGAGFPGLPMKIAEPSIRLTLLDALLKRVEFLSDLCAELGDQETVCLHARAEEAAAPGGDLRESFDFAVSRAVASLATLCELSLPFVRPGGRFIAMKSIGSEEEVQAAGNAIALLGGVLEATRDYEIPGTGIIHRVVVIRKDAPTPGRYPRRFSKIKKAPL